MDPADWVTMREAASMLAPAGVSRETTRRLLLAGLAGETVRRGNGTLHQRERVAELRDRPWVGACGVSMTVGGRRTFVARLRTHPVLPVEERWEAARGPWRISALGRARLRLTIAQDGFVPLVATLGGFVVLGAEMVDVHGEGAAGGRLSLRRPGAWFDEWERRRVRPLGRHPWWIWPDGLWSRADLDAAQGGRPGHD